MQQNIEEEILRILRERGELFAPEAEIISAVFARLRSDQGRILLKDIILSLIAELESTSDVVRLDVLRGALEIVVGVTPELKDNRVPGF